MNEAFAFFVILLGMGIAVLEANALPTGSEDSYQTVLPLTQRPVLDVSGTVNGNITVTQSTIPFRPRASYKPRPIQHIPYTLSPIDNISTATPSPSDLIENRSMCFNSNVGKFCIVLDFSLENNSSIPDNFLETSPINNSTVRHWHLNKNGSLCYGSICVYLISAEEETSVSSAELADVSTFTTNYGDRDEDSLTTTVGSTMRPWDSPTCRTVGCLPSRSLLEFSPTDENVENSSTETEEPTPLSAGMKAGDLITISSLTTSDGSIVTEDGIKPGDSASTSDDSTETEEPTPLSVGIKEDDLTTISSLTTSDGFIVTEDGIKPGDSAATLSSTSDDSTETEEPTPLSAERKAGDLIKISSLTTSDISIVAEDGIKPGDLPTTSSSTTSDGSTVTADLINEDMTTSDGSTVTANGIKPVDLTTPSSSTTSDGSTVTTDLIEENAMATTSSWTTSDGSTVKGGLTTVAVSSTTCQPGFWNFWHCS